LNLPGEHTDLIKALQTAGYQPKMMFSAQGTEAEFPEVIGSAVNGVLVWSTWHPDAAWEGMLGGETFTNTDFVREFETRYGRSPDEDVAQAFTSCQGMEQAARETGTTDNTVMRDWLAARTKDDPVKTIQGDFYWDETNLVPDRNLLLLQWQDQELQFVFPIGEFPGTVDILWPKPQW
jgi:branched-chain amino acid transport system substrate-binding protein